ncbi:MAG: nicotinate phosphoribosyltransferase, partial [Clostridia bacterium]
LGIRLDSGDLAYLSREARKMLDSADLKDVKIFASGDIDEEVLLSLHAQGCKIDCWGIGTRLITSDNCSSLGGVYKLAGIEENGKIIPKLKKSDTPEKITNPGLKKVVRFYSKIDNKAIADLICLKEESFENLESLEIFHPNYVWKKTLLTNFYTKDLLVDIFKGGKLVYKKPTIKEIRANAKLSNESFWEEIKRILNPEIYKVDLSQKLYDLKQELLTSK